MRKNNRDELIQVFAEELAKQDIELEKIHRRRKEISTLCYKLNIYEEVENLLFSDGKSHCMF